MYSSGSQGGGLNKLLREPQDDKKFHENNLKQGDTCTYFYLVIFIIFLVIPSVKIFHRVEIVSGGGGL